METDRGSGPAFLFELRGKAPGSVHELYKRDVFRIGSDGENDLCLPDSGIALFQVEVRMSGSQLLIRNIAPEVPVYLNGEPVEESSLHKGDILSIGNAMFRFVEHGETLTQEELWRPVGGKMEARGAAVTSRMRRVPFLGALTLVALGVALAVFLSQKEQGPRLPWEQPGKGIEEKRALPVDRRALMDAYELAKDLMAARRWDEAVVALDKVRRDVPNFKDTAKLYEEAVVESRNVDVLNTGKGLMIEGELARAKQALERLSENSVYYREAERLIREIEDGLLALGLTEAEKQLARNDWSSARRQTESILARYPNNREALRILREARQLQQEGQGRRRSRGPGRAPATPPASAGDAGRSADAGADGADPTEAGPAQGPAETVEASKAASPPAPRVVRSMRRGAAQGGDAGRRQRAIRAYRQGEIDRAIRTLQPLVESGDEEARRMARDLRAAETHFRQASTLQEAGRYAEALEEWDLFLDRDRRLTGGRKGVRFEAASGSLATIYYLRGKGAFDQGDLPRASRFWTMAGRIDPGSEEVRKGLKQLARSAQRVFREGYSLQSINPKMAVEKWEEVLEIVPSSDPYYQKAKQQIERHAVIP